MIEPCPACGRINKTGCYSTTLKALLFTSDSDQNTRRYYFHCYCGHRWMRIERPERAEISQNQLDTPE